MPHVTGVDDRPLAARLGERDQEAPPGPTLGGESVSVRSEVHERKLRAANAGPNAPLLIRMVRHPYGIRPAQFGKREGTQRPDPGEGRPPISGGRLRPLLEESHLEFAGSPTERILAEVPPHPFRRRRDDDDFDTVPVGVK